MEAVFQSADESFRETLPDRRWANGNVARSRLRPASQARIRRSQKGEVLLLPTSSVCGLSMNRFGRLHAQPLALHLHSVAMGYARGAMPVEQIEQNSSR